MASRERRLLGLALTLRPYTALLLVLAVLYVPWVASIPLDGTLEGNRLESAREMLTSGDWLVPRLGGTVYLAKPPLHPWTVALLGWPRGDVSIASGRAVSIAAAIATCCLVACWGRRELGRRTGATSAIVLGSSIVFAEKAMRAELESELTLFTTLALLALWDARHAQGKRAFLSCVVSGLALGAAVLVKGPPPLIVYLAAAAALCVTSTDRRRRAALAAATSAVGLALVCALAWVVPVCARVGLASAWHSLHLQFFERIVDAGRTNAEPFWFYLPALLLGLLPATSLLPVVALVRPLRGDGPTRERATFLWAWALLPLVLFSLSEGKETRYLLPTLPAWSVLLAWGWTRARASRRLVRWRDALASALRAGTWLAPFAWLVAGSLRYAEARAAVALSASCALAGRAAFVWSARTDRPTAALVAVLLVLGAGKLAWAGTALARQERAIPVADVGRALAARLAPDERWILLGSYRSWLHFAVDRPCVAVATWNGLDEARRRSAARYLLARAESIPADARTFAQEERWVIDGEPYCLLRAGQ